MPKLEVNDVDLHYDLAGAENLPVLVLSNSLGTDLSLWAEQVDVFAQNFRVLRYDTRGHGRSSVPEGPYTIEQMGRDVLGLLDALHLRRVHFCGVSMGAMTGLWLGIHARERIGRLVIANTAAQIGNAEGWNERIALVRSLGMEGIAAAVIERWFTESFPATHLEEVARLRATLELMDSEGYCASCAAVRDMDLREDVASIDAATLILCGEVDPVTPPEAAVFLNSRIRNSKLLSLPAAHLSNVEAAERFTAAVLSFLQEDAGPGGAP